MTLRLRRLIPDSLVGRTLLVLISGLVLSQLAGVLLFSSNRLEATNRLGYRLAAEHVASVAHLLEESNAADRQRVMQTVNQPGLRIGWGSTPITVTDGVGPAAEVREELIRRLPNHEIHSDSVLPPGPPHASPPESGPAPGPGIGPGIGPGPGHPPRGEGPMRPPDIRVAIAIADGSWLNFVLPHQHPPEPLWRLAFLGPLGTGLLVVTLLSVLAVRRATKPLNLLAHAAEQLGRDVTAPPIPENGPREVRAAAQAFNQMQSRLRKFIEDRTQMFAAISHDLRTPLTRMKLRAEFVEDDEQRQKMLHDLDEMETMIASTLAFARDDTTREERRMVDLMAVLKLCQADFGGQLAGPDQLMVKAGPLGLKRALGNLLENSAKYGKNAQITVSLSQGQVTVFIDDEGPGLPVGELERVFTPFYRLETSRNRSTGGTGLGLSIARSVLRAHGGDVTLANRDSGGLRATVTLPA
ncbi:MAG TPA: HAMP domain-containing protein [Rhodospirillaceae bacterium]|nr:HAMP domain-containing protein [Rhodospirillaceae bacterium]